MRYTRYSQDSRFLEGFKFGTGHIRGEVASTALPGVWVRVGAAGSSRSGRVLADKSASDYFPSYAVILFFTDLRYDADLRDAVGASVRSPLRQYFSRSIRCLKKLV